MEDGTLYKMSTKGRKGRKGCRRYVNEHGTQSIDIRHSAAAACSRFTMIEESDDGGMRGRYFQDTIVQTTESLEKAFSRLRELAPVARGGITQPSKSLLESLCR